MTERLLGAEGDRRKRAKLLLPLLALAALVVLLMGGALVKTTTATAAPSGIEPKFVNFGLEGCRNDGTITLPNGSGDYICPDSAYVSGNLGKGWNELDVVPHRVTASLGNQATATTTYDVFVAADNLDGGTVGYDILSAPELNAAKSHSSCQILDVGAETDGGAVTGGADNAIYRSVTLSHDKGTTCVIDYVIRLALGASDYSGSSLQSYMFEKSDLSTGKRTIPIPVDKILPQELSKDMAATRDADHVWNLTKAPTPATVSFGDVCADGFTNTQGVQIKIEWTRGPATPSGQATVITNIYATNPAARIITVNVTDNIYEGATQTTLLDTKNSGDVDVDPNTTALVLTHQAPVTTSATSLNDVATATYKDKVFPDVSIPGETTATASATVQSGTTTNQSANIRDSESLTGSGLTFAVASPAVGSFTNGYTAGSYTTGPVLWASGTQNDSGSVTFSKTLKLDPKQTTSGTLSDHAELKGSNGGSAFADLDVGVSSTATVSLTIDKTIPNVLQTNESVTFYFDVKQGGSTVATTSLTFAAGETSKSVTLPGLAPGSYTVQEQTPPAPWTAQSDQQASIGVPACSGSVSFSNGFAPAAAQAKKITNPAGGEAGWELILTGPGTAAGGEKITTAGSGFEGFTTVLQEGSYTITETQKTGWDLTGAAGSGGATGGATSCTFTVDYPADAGKLYGCAFTNVQRGKIIVKKETIPDGSTQSFKFDPDYGPDFSLKDGESNDSGYLVAGTYSVAEGVPDGWDLDSATCDDGSAPGSIGLVAGETVTCTFTNSQRGKIIVKKETIPDGSTQSFKFDPDYGPDFSLKDGESNDSGYLVAGTYSVAEGVPDGWDLDSATCDDGSAPGSIGLVAGETVTCTFTNSQRGKIIVKKETIPDGSTQSFKFDPDYGPDFSLKDGESNDSGYLVAGTYSVAEGVPDGWDLTSKTCSDGSEVNAIALAAGETVTCTFTNTQRGKIIVKKETIPDGSTQSFKFDPDYGPDFSLKDGESNDSGYLVAGTYSVAEGVPDGWDLTSKTCSDGSEVNAIALAAGETVTCTFTNTQRGKIIVKKETNPDASTQSFEFNPSWSDTNFSLKDGEQSDSGLLVPGGYSVSESVPAGWDLTSKTCDDGSEVNAIALAAGETVTCTFTNTQRGKAKVVKTVSSSAPSGTHAFTFQLRQDASPTQNGTTLETAVANAANGGVIQFNTFLVPGATYQLCEIVMPAWLTSLGTFVPGSFNPPDGVVPNPNVDNSILCANFTVAAGETKTFTIDNTPPPGGRALTIGFWKNWASCSGGKQKPVLDDALAAAVLATTNPPAGLVVSAQYLGSGWPNFAAAYHLVLKGADCQKAVSLLDKSSFDGKKKASDPLFNMTAQLVAAQLNYFVGAGKNGSTTTNIGSAVTLNGKYKFVGSGYTGKLSNADASKANCLATQLDNYNNNRSVSTCP